MLTITFTKGEVMTNSGKLRNGVTPADACPAFAMIEAFAGHEDLYSRTPGCPP